MREKKLQVFVSSSFTDLKQERQAAVEAILSSGNIPAGMELFSAGDESQMTIIERWIDESDVYMLILGGRYGSIEPKSGKSYTQLEYEYALEKNKPLFAVVLSETAIDDKVKIDGKSVLENENNHLLKEFKELVTSKMVKFCDDAKDIKLAIHETLSDFSYNKELIGWIRGDNALNSSLLAEEIARLTKENNELIKNKGVKQETKYLGLTFNEMKQILSSTELQDDGTNYKGNLYDYFKRCSSNLLNHFLEIENHNSKNISKLKELGLVKVQRESYSLKRYIMSEEGHKFYLKTLIEEN